jgi:hypothetical protein
VSPRREHSELVKSTWAQGLPLCLLLVGGEGSAVWKAAGAHNSCTIEQEENGYLLSLSSRSDPHQLSKQPRRCTEVRFFLSLGGMSRFLLIRTHFHNENHTLENKLLGIVQMYVLMIKHLQHIHTCMYIHVYIS